MANVDHRLEEAYTSLCKILRDPHEFGLGVDVPPSLVDQLEKTLGLLSEVMDAPTLGASNGDLAAELSQDADHPRQGICT